MPSVLVDTDTLYQYLVGSDGLSPGAVQLIEKAIETGDLCISVVTVIQLKDLNTRKRLKDEELRRVEELLIATLSRIQILPLDYETALHFESVIDNSKFADRAIAATAHLRGLTLVTTNIALRGNPDIDTLWAGEPMLMVAGVRSP